MQTPARPVGDLTNPARKSKRISRFGQLSPVEPGPFLTKPRTTNLKSDLFGLCFKKCALLEAVIPVQAG